MGLRFETLVCILIVWTILIAHEDRARAYGSDLGKGSVGHLAKLDNLFSALKQTSRQGASYVSDLLVSIPFGKIALASGALLSIFFLFIRLIVVLGPILILGAMTRESTDATDLLRMLIEFYNQIIVSLDEQMTPPPPQSEAVPMQH